MNFIADGLVGLVSGVASAIVLAWYGWWQAIVLVLAWSATHWLLRESAVWRDRRTPEVQRAQRHADYSYRLAVDPPAAKEVRLFGLADWVIDRFTAQRRRLYDLQYEATRLRERSVAGCVVIVVAANVRRVLVARPIAPPTAASTWPAAIVALQAAIGVSAIAFGGLNWALDGAAAPVAAVGPPRGGDGRRPARSTDRRPAPAPPAGAGPELRFRDVSFGYPGGPLVLDGFDLDDPGRLVAGHRRPERRRQDDAGQAAVPPVRPASPAPIEVDGIDLRQLDLDDVAAAASPPCSRTSCASSCRCATTWRRAAARRRRRSLAALDAAGAGDLADARHDPGQGLPGRHRPVGGQWQRVALARALCAVRGGAGVVLLDEPTAQLDVRGEAEIFERILDATRGLHDDPHLPPLLDGAPRRPHLRARARRRRRARHARRADGRAAAATARCSTSRHRGSSSSTSTARRSSMSRSTEPAPRRPAAAPCRRCGARSASATAPSRACCWRRSARRC